MLVLVAEADVDYAEIVAESLRRDSHRVVIAGSASGARHFVERGFPDMAIVSAELPDGSGLDIVRELREESVDLPIIMLSAHSRCDDIVAGFESGADDYIAKPFHPREFVARVRAVIRRAGSRASSVPVPEQRNLGGEGLEFDHDNSAVYLDGVNLNCTRLEFDILKELAAVPGQVLSHAFLNERIWDYSNMHDGTLLKGHISALRRKMKQAGAATTMIRTVHGVGYSLAA